MLYLNLAFFCRTIWIRGLGSCCKEHSRQKRTPSNHPFCTHLLAQEKVTHHSSPQWLTRKQNLCPCWSYSLLSRHLQERSQTIDCHPTSQNYRANQLQIMQGHSSYKPLSFLSSQSKKKSNGQEWSCPYPIWNTANHTSRKISLQPEADAFINPWVFQLATAVGGGGFPRYWQRVAKVANISITHGDSYENMAVMMGWLWIGRWR